MEVILYLILFLLLAWIISKIVLLLLGVKKAPILLEILTGVGLLVFTYMFMSMF